MLGIRLHWRPQDTALEQAVVELVHWLSYQTPKWTPANGDRSYWYLGTGLEGLSRRALIWGAGISHEGDQPPPLALYFAVRGPRTQVAIMEQGGKAPDLYGSPLMLLPRLHPGERSSQYRLGVLLDPRDDEVPAEGESPILPMGSIDIQLINPKDPWRTIVDQMLVCDGIASSWLSGLEVAYGYGLPAAWIRLRGSQVPPEPILDFLEAHHPPEESITAYDLEDLSYKSLAQVTPWEPPELNLRPFLESCNFNDRGAI